MQNFKSSVSDFFSALQDEAGLKLFPSPIVISVDCERGTFEGHYAFFGPGAVRAELQGEEIRGVSIWTTPGDLNHPQFFIDMTRVDAFAEIDVVAKAMRGQAATLTRDQGSGFFESALSQDASEVAVGEFMASIGPFAWDKKLTTIFDSYEVWASVHSKPVLSKAYFMSLAKDWLIRNGQGSYKDVEISQASGTEKTQVNTAQEDLFDSEVVQNPFYYKAVMLETALKQVAQDDPLINGLYLCGGPGDNRRYMVRDLFQREGVWDSKVVWKSGSVHGIGSLMETLWRNRSGKILVLEDVDDLMKKNRGKARDLLLRVLVTEDPTRVVSYTRIKRTEHE